MGSKSVTDGRTDGQIWVGARDTCVSENLPKYKTMSQNVKSYQNKTLPHHRMMLNPPKIKTLPHYTKTSQIKTLPHDGKSSRNQNIAALHKNLPNRSIAELCKILPKSNHCRIIQNPPKIKILAHYAKSSQNIAAVCKILPKSKPVFANSLVSHLNVAKLVCRVLFPT